jgi:hypothetical protein
MRHTMTGVVVATAGLMVAKIGQGVTWSTAWDPFWAFVGVTSLLGGVAIAMSPRLDRAFARARTAR